MFCYSTFRTESGNFLCLRLNRSLQAERQKPIKNSNLSISFKTLNYLYFFTFFIDRKKNQYFKQKITKVRIRIEILKFSAFLMPLVFTVFNVNNLILH